jgi:plastocyanin
MTTGENAMPFAISRPSRLARAASVAAVLLLTAASAGATPPFQVKIQNFVFDPRPLTVPAGTTVTWTNEDDIPHTVTTEDRRIKSPVLDTGDKFSFTFDKPGSYTYFCSLHPHMTGTVVVLPAMRSSAR